MSQDFGQNEPLDDWSRKMQDIMEEMLNRGSFLDFRRARPWKPSANLYERGDAFLVCVELAGVESVEIETRNEPRPALRIVGVRSQPRPKDGGEMSIAMLEIDEGPFARVVELPGPIDTESVETTFMKGYVWISMPKKTSR